MICLESDLYVKILPLLNKIRIEDKTVILSVIHRKIKGCIFVDDVNHPNVALIWAINLMQYMVGDASRLNAHDMKRFIHDVFYPLNNANGATTMIVTICEGHTFDHLFDEMLLGVNHEKGYRQSFLFQNKYIRPQVSNATSSVVLQIDDSTRHEKYFDDILDIVLEFWDTYDSFVKNGIGYYVLANNEVMSCCLTCGSHDNYQELSIETYDKSKMNKGYGSMATKEMIMHCKMYNQIPVWSTYEENHASMKIAEKVGFIKHHKLRFYEFLFEDLCGIEEVKNGKQSLFSR